MSEVSRKKMLRKEKAPDSLIAQAIGGKLKRDTCPGT
jgi:hypothetical protein